MDTGTHLVFGLGLAGLAHVDPVIAENSVAASAVLIGTVLGQQAPDLDGLLRFRGNAVYIRNHRGASHSLPAILLWSSLITLILDLAFTDLPIWHIGLWVLIAVCFHVFSDLFNTYGTQAFRPLTEKWISWNIIHIFDPFLFLSHLAAILLWALGAAAPERIFPILYGTVGLYYVWRSLHHAALERQMPKLDPDFHTGDRYYLTPTVNWNQWNLIKRVSDGSYRLGEWRSGEPVWNDHITCASHPAVDASRNHPDVASFLYFSSFACAEVRKHPWGYEVRWMDVRYRHRKQYPFVAVLLMDQRYQPIDSYVGWLSDERLQKRLRVNI